LLIAARIRNAADFSGGRSAPQCEEISMPITDRIGSQEPMTQGVE
jgi:hypothetical protein